MRNRTMLTARFPMMQLISCLESIDVERYQALICPAVLRERYFWRLPNLLALRTQRRPAWFTSPHGAHRQRQIPEPHRPGRPHGTSRHRTFPQVMRQFRLICAPKPRSPLYPTRYGLRACQWIPHFSVYLIPFGGTHTFRRKPHFLALPP